MYVQAGMETCYFIAAELVSWNSSGDQYVLSYGEFLLVHEVKV